MKQREVKDNENISWTCVQAFGGSSGEAAKAASQRAKTNGSVDVICTPSGGAQSVRIKANTNWLEDLSDEELLQMIAAQRK